jgi:hypothetical protein
VREYIAPPNTISVETEGYGRNYGFAQYIERKEVEKTFALPPLALPSPTGVFPNQPSPYRKNTFFLVTGFLCFLLSLVASAAYFSQRPEQVTALSGVVNPGMASGPIITETFEFTDDGNVGFHLNGEVSNSWVDVDISIINAVNQSALDTAVGVSFYFGREDGEGWSEGSKTATTTIGDIPRGKYYFTIQATGGGNTDGRPIRYDLSIIRHDRYFGNFLLALILGILPVIWNVFGSWGFETKRWATSTQVAQSS